MYKDSFPYKKIVFTCSKFQKAFFISSRIVRNKCLVLDCFLLQDISIHRAITIMISSSFFLVLLVHFLYYFLLCNNKLYKIVMLDIHKKFNKLLLRLLTL